MIHLLDPLPTLVDTVSNVHVFAIFSDRTALSDDDVRGLGDEVCSCNVDGVRLFLITHQAITQAEHTTIATRHSDCYYRDYNDDAGWTTEIKLC